MDSSDADSEPTDRFRSRWAVIPAVVLAVLLGSSLLFLATSLVDSSVAAGGIVILALVALAVLQPRTASSTDEAGDTGSDVAAGGDRSGGDGAESNVWNAIPPWQYDGRHAESGGLTRGEQERALRDIQRQADELEE